MKCRVEIRNHGNTIVRAVYVAGKTPAEAESFALGYVHNKIRQELEKECISSEEIQSYLDDLYVKKIDILYFDAGVALYYEYEEA